MVDWALEVTRLEECAGTYVENLSGGQRQRVWIAMALAQRTPIILLDEPTTYLDLAYQLEIMELLEELNRCHQTTIVMVLHDLNLAARFADYMIAMRDGRLVCHGTPVEVMRTEVLRETFHINATIVTDNQSKKPTLLTYHLIQNTEEIERGA